MRNPSFSGDWAQDWVGSVTGETLTSVQEVSTNAYHHEWDWGRMSCDRITDEQVSLSNTARDDGGQSYAESITLAKTQDNHLRYTASLYSSGYAYAHAGSSDGVCGGDCSHAEVSWSLNDVALYQTRVTQELNPFPQVQSLDYAVLSANYKMTTTFQEVEDWYAEISWVLEGPSGTEHVVRDEFFSSEIMSGVERGFNEEIRPVMIQEGAGIYKLHVDMDFRLHHQDARSNSQTNNDGVTAQTSNIIYDDAVTLEIYEISIPWAQGLVPPLMNSVSPNPSTDGVAHLSWGAVTEAEGYQVYRCAQPFTFVTDPGVALVATVPGTSYDDTGLATGTYYYAVQSVKAGANPSGLSAYERVDVILPPAAPVLSPLSPNPDEDGQISLSWTAVAGADGYRIFMSSAPITDVSGMQFAYATTQTSYTIPFLDEGTYHFAVVGHNYAGNGALSNNAQVTVAVVNPPAAPVLLPIEGGSDNDGVVHIAWNASSGARSYAVYRSNAVITSVAGLTPVAITPLTSFVDRSVADDTTYYYAIVASNARGNSNMSNCETVAVAIPNFIEIIGDFINDMDPLTRDIVYKVVGLLLDDTGTSLLDFLRTRQGSWSGEFDIGIGDWDDLGGAMGLSLGLDITVNLTLTGNSIGFIITPQSEFGFDLHKMALAGYFGEASAVISQFSAFGISMDTRLDINGRIAFTVHLDNETVSVDEIGLQIMPRITVTVNILKAILTAAAPEAEPVISQIVSLVDQLTGYNVYGIFISQITFVVNFIMHYYPAADRFVADCQLTMNFDVIRVNIIQPKSGDVDEISIGLLGVAGVNYDSATGQITTCGGLDFYVNFDLANCDDTVAGFITTMAGWSDLSVTETNVWHLIGSPSSCAPISLAPSAPSAAQANLDMDNDYLTYQQELALGTSDNNPDTDFDGLWDFIEAQEGSNLLTADSDGDGLDDYFEFYNSTTNLTAVDTDADGLTDPQEVLIHGTSPLSADTDGDRLSDLNETTSGTNPLVADSDGDGVADGWEVTWYGSSPSTAASRPADTDGDSLRDVDETQLFNTNPYQNEAGDPDNDGLRTYQELILYAGLNPNSADTDDDSLLDGAEILNGTDYLSPDTDSDQLSDGDEVLVYGTDPLNADTDGDGFSDSMEVRLGSNPLSAASTPAGGMSGAALTWVVIGIAIVGGAVAGYFVVKARRDPFRRAGIKRKARKRDPTKMSLKQKLSSAKDKIKSAGTKVKDKVKRKKSKKKYFKLDE